MATYITLMKYTQDGVKNIKNSPARLDEAKCSPEEFSPPGSGDGFPEPSFSSSRR